MLKLKWRLSVFVKNKIFTEIVHSKKFFKQNKLLKHNIVILDLIEIFLLIIVG